MQENYIEYILNNINCSEQKLKKYTQETSLGDLNQYQNEEYISDEFHELKFKALYLPTNKKCTLHFLLNPTKPLGLLWYNQINSWIINNNIVPNVESIIESNLQDKIDLRYQSRFSKHIHQKSMYYYAHENEYKSLHDYLDLELLNNNELVAIMGQVDSYLKILSILGITHKNLTIDTVKLTIIDNPMKYKIYDNTTKKYTYIAVEKYLIVFTRFDDMSVSEDSLIFNKYIKCYKHDIPLIYISNYYGLYDYNSFYLSLLIIILKNEKYTVYRNHLINDYLVPLLTLNKIKDIGIGNIFTIENSINKYLGLPLGAALAGLGIYGYRKFNEEEDVQPSIPTIQEIIDECLKSLKKSMIELTNLNQKLQDVILLSTENIRIINNMRDEIRDIEREDTKQIDILKYKEFEGKLSGTIVNQKLIHLMEKEDEYRKKILETIENTYINIVNNKLSNERKNIVTEIISSIYQSHYINEKFIIKILDILSKVNNIDNFEKIKFNVMTTFLMDSYNSFSGNKYWRLKWIYDYEEKTAVKSSSKEEFINRLYDEYISYFFEIDDEVKLTNLSHILRNGDYFLYEKKAGDHPNPLFNDHRNNKNILILKNMIYIFSEPGFLKSFLYRQKIVYLDSNFMSKRRLVLQPNSIIEAYILKYLEPLEYKIGGINVLQSFLNTKYEGKLTLFEYDALKRRYRTEIFKGISLNDEKKYDIDIYVNSSINVIRKPIIGDELRTQYANCYIKYYNEGDDSSLQSCYNLYIKYVSYVNDFNVLDYRFFTENNIPIKYNDRSAFFEELFNHSLTSYNDLISAEIFQLKLSIYEKGNEYIVDRLKYYIAYIEETQNANYYGNIIELTSRINGLPAKFLNIYFNDKIYQKIADHLTSLSEKFTVLNVKGLFNTIKNAIHPNWYNPFSAVIWTTLIQGMKMILRKKAVSSLAKNTTEAFLEIIDTLNSDGANYIITLQIQKLISSRFGADNIKKAFTYFRNSKYFASNLLPEDPGNSPSVFVDFFTPVLHAEFPEKRDDERKTLNTDINYLTVYLIIQYFDGVPLSTMKNMINQKITSLSESKNVLNFGEDMTSHISSFKDYLKGIATKTIPSILSTVFTNKEILYSMGIDVKNGTNMASIFGMLDHLHTNDITTYKMLPSLQDKYKNEIKDDDIILNQENYIEYGMILRSNITSNL